jgi:hypothetical protein
LENASVRSALRASTRRSRESATDTAGAAFGVVPALVRAAGGVGTPVTGGASAGGVATGAAGGLAEAAALGDGARGGGGFGAKRS